MNASPQATVDEINRSLANFENGALLVRSQGRLELYSSLNEMLRRHKLRNTAGPVYAPLIRLEDLERPQLRPVPEMRVGRVYTRGSVFLSRLRYHTGTYVAFLTRLKAAGTLLSSTR